MNLAEKREVIDKLIINLGEDMEISNRISEAFYNLREKVVANLSDTNYRNNDSEFSNLVLKFILRKVTLDWRIKLDKEKKCWQKEFAICKDSKNVKDIIKLIQKKNKKLKKITKTKVNKNLQQITQEDFLLDLCRESREMHMVVLGYLTTAAEITQISAYQDAKMAKLLDEIDDDLIRGFQNE